MNNKTLQIGDRFTHVHSGKTVKIVAVYFDRVDVKWPTFTATYTKKMIYGSIKRKSLLRVG